MNGLSLAEALKKLEVENANHWTADGLPRIETLQFLTADTTLTRDMVNAYVGFTRDTATTFFSDESGEPSIPATVPLPPIEIPATLPEVDAPKDEEIELRDDIASLDQEIEDLTSEIDKARSHLVKLTEEVSVKRERLSEIVGIETTQDAINSYLNRQKEHLQNRGSRLKMIAESGINLKDLAHDLKAPIDVKPKKRRAR